MERGYRENIGEDTGRILKKLQRDYWIVYLEDIEEVTGSTLERIQG